MSMQSPEPVLILASRSAARLAVLQAAGMSVLVQPLALDEDMVKRQARADGMAPGTAALHLARLKAACIEDPDALVIAADQILVCDGRWFDKPGDRSEARHHLQALRGRSHTLYTAVVCSRHRQVVWEHVATPSLRMREASDRVIDAYLALEGDAVLSSVGAYRLEGPGIQLFDGIEGEHAAILGLPMLPLLDFLRRYGVLPS